LLKLTVERALQVEMEEPLGYAKHAQEGHGSGNSRNGYSSKTLKGNIGEVEIQPPGIAKGALNRS
jgi:transposase-like protein